MKLGFWSGWGKPLSVGVGSLGGSNVLPPAQPTGLTATPASSTQINLAWTDNASDETAYRVYRSTDGVIYSQVGSDLAAGTQAYNDTPVTGGTKYYYKVAAVSAGGETLSTAATANTINLFLVIDWEMYEVSTGVAPVTRDDSVGTNDLTDVTNVVGDATDGADFESSTSEYLRAASNAAFHMGDIDFTMEIWVKAETVGTSCVAGVWSDAVNKREYALWIITNKFNFFVSSNGSAQNSVQADNIGVLSAATWYHAVMWHDAAANTLNISVNNGTANSAAYSSGVTSNDAAFGMGTSRSDGTPASFYDGRLNRCRIWKRVLSADERTWLYNAGTGRTYSNF